MSTAALGQIDPRLLAAILNGGPVGNTNTVSFGGGSNLVAQPEQKMRLMMADRLMGSDPASARTKGEGLARLGQQALGAFLTYQGLSEAKQQQDSDSDLLSAALRSQDRTPTNYTDDDGKPQTITWNKPDPSRMASILGQGSPQLQREGLAMALTQQQRDADLALKQVKLLTPDESVAAGFPQGSVVQKDAYGKLDPVYKPEVFTPFATAPGGGASGKPSTGLMGSGSPGSGPAPAMPAGGTQTVPRAGVSGGVPMSPQAAATIGVESGGNVDATNPNSSATGPGQFIDSTWLDLTSRHAPGLVQGKSWDEVLAMRSDPEVSAKMIDAYAAENAAALEKAGIQPTQENLYFSHVFGPAGAVKMLTADPRAAAATLNSKGVVDANRSLFLEQNGRPRTVAELQQMLAGRFNKNLPQTAEMPAIQPPAAGAPMPQVAPPGTADALPNPATGRPVQVAQAPTGTMTDAAPALPNAPPSAAPSQGRDPGDWVTGTFKGQVMQYSPTTGEYRPYQAPTSDERGYRLAQSQGYKGTFMEYLTDLKRAGKPETTIDMKQEGEEAKAEGRRLVDEYKSIQERGQAAQDAVNQIGIARAIPEVDQNGQALPSVFQQKVGNAAVALGFNPENPTIKAALGRVSDGQSFTGVMQNLVLTKMAAQKGPQTENDAKRIESTVATLGNTPEARDFLLRTSAALAQRDVDQQAFYERWKASKGSYAGASKGWRDHIGTVPLVGVQPSTGKPVFFDEFQRAYQRQHPDAAADQILNDWRTIYAAR